MRPEPLPKPPRDVRLTYTDGRTVAVSCVYEGWLEDRQMHRWVIVDAPPGRLRGITVGLLPARTTIGVLTNKETGEVVQP